MPEEIGLQELLYQVKKELLAQSPDDPVPLFYVEGVDLELSITARKEAQAGVKIYVDAPARGPLAKAAQATGDNAPARGPLVKVAPVTGERAGALERAGASVVDVGGGGGHERAQTVRVSLRPLYSREEMRRFVEQDPVLGPRLRKIAMQGAIKGGLFED